MATDVVKRLGRTLVLRRLGCSFESGAIHFLRGANGSGKSTLLSILGGRLPADQGQVTLKFDESQPVCGAEVRRHIGWLGHDLGLYGELTVGENLALHGSLAGSRVSGPGDLAVWGLEGLWTRRARDLSRGQRQKVALARLLLREPRVVLMDEPSTALDPAAVRTLAGLLQRLADEGRVVVVASHDEALMSASPASQRWTLRVGQLTAG